VCLTNYYLLLFRISSKPPSRTYERILPRSAHFIVDQSRSGVQNIRLAWGDWCNVSGAGFGIQPTTDTGNTLIDAIVWAKPGGEGDGTSDTTSVRYDSFCGNADAAKPAPEAGAYFFLVHSVRKCSLIHIVVLLYDN